MDFTNDLIYVKNQISKVQALSKKNKCIYTCMIGEFDKIPKKIDLSDEYDFFFITDKQNIGILNSNIVYTNLFHRSNRRTNRFFKILPHLIFESYLSSIYIDANLILKVKSKNLFHKLRPKVNFVTFEHNKRKCLYREVEECILWSKDSKDKLLSQKHTYKKNNMPINFGLFLGSVLIRNHNEITSFSEFWWDQYEKFSARDQISLAYSSFKLNFKISTIDYKKFEDYFNKIDHLSKEVNESELSFYEKIKFKLLFTLVKLKKLF